MPLPRGVDLLPDEVRAGLDPGEVPVAYEAATQLSGHSGIGAPERPPADLGFSFDPVAGGIQVNEDWMAAAVGGTNASGAVGSLADRFSRALEPASAHLLLTDRRLAVVATDAPLRGPVTQRVAFTVDRRAVAGARPAPRLFQRGRVRLDFVDGSWAMVMMGVVKRAAARRFLAACGAVTDP